ncbi:MAG: aldo/keto reductase, partial [Gammaproteobacteria bacterium]|nr:aldo/keto reductase [Gammaproteobacteria bacterium]
MSKMKPGLTRRHFLKTTGAASLLCSLVPGHLVAADSAVIKKAIPSTGERLSVIGLGTSRTFNVDSTTAAKSPLLEVMQAFFDNHGQLIDSSPMYGSAEAVTGRLIERVNNTQDLFSATKVWTSGKRQGIDQMEQSMRRL